MDPSGGDPPNFDYLLGVGGAASAVLASGPGATGLDAASVVQPESLSGGVTSTTTDGNTAVDGTGNGAGLNAPDGPTFSAAVVGDGTGPDTAGYASANDTAGTADGAGTSDANPKKRPLEDKKARDRKRILRNRQLARVSNERRKGRIKAMENELTETRNTVSTLEESIRCLEEENRELRNLLQGRSDATVGVPQQTVGTTPTTAAPAEPPPTTLSSVMPPQPPGTQS